MKIKCEICGVELIRGNPDNCYGTSKGRNHISPHHLFPKRFKKFFSENEIVKNFGVNNFEEKANLCFDCHEEMIHNIVLTKEIIEKLRIRMKNKDIKGRIETFYKIFKRGLNAN
ncbi:MAG: hypothetical protein PHO48_00695 [Candidatus Gracilibacteria bacterium]|jgi:hypothetical protein|nr:hypothetical protein [Candidatus Gracilibacteria bacterium]